MLGIVKTAKLEWFLAPFLYDGESGWLLDSMWL